MTLWQVLRGDPEARVEVCVLAALLVAGVLLAGCDGGAGSPGNGDRANIPRSALRSLVLQPTDLPEVWVRFDEGRQTRRDSPSGERADPARFGRLGGWKARYRRPGSRSTQGPLVIESRADLFGDAGGAKRDFDLLERDLGASLGLELERGEASGLGDDAAAGAVVQGDERSGVRYVVVAWRYGNVVGTLVANGFAPSFTATQGLSLARTQQQKIAAAG